MDALPITEETGLPFSSEVEGKMHACGHDGHTSMLVGAAHALSGMRESLNGTVKFLFQPAEEGGGGGRVMVEEGVADGLGSIFALHLWPGLPFGTVATKGARSWPPPTPSRWRSGAPGGTARCPTSPPTPSSSPPTSSRPSRPSSPARWTRSSRRC
jgi:metal-dependent amidase/aminoacylase/carboxypeptidase family protein